MTEYCHSAVVLNPKELSLDLPWDLGADTWHEPVYFYDQSLTSRNLSTNRLTSDPKPTASSRHDLQSRVLEGR